MSASGRAPGRAVRSSHVRAAAVPIEQRFHAHRRMLWGLSYRLTGVAADADEIVQETFLRALGDRALPAPAEERAWLVRVATNLSIDVLRRRKRRGYAGSWLPSPVETPDEDAATLAGGGVPGSSDVEARYAELESLSYAFLIALEALGPRSRAVLILRDVLDYSAREAGEALGISEANARVLHHRARRRMADYDRDRRPPTGELREETRRALQALLSCLVRQDAAGLETLLAAAARTVTDGGGRFTALPAPLVGRSRVARFHLQVARERAPISRFEIRSVNGLPAVIIETASRRPRQAPHVVLRCELDTAGRIRELHSILAPGKLSAVRFGSA